MTSIEWLFQLSKQRELDKFDLKQAKEMHKQEIENAYEEGYNRAVKVIEDEIQRVLKNNI